MKKLITPEQQQEIVMLAKDHLEALAAYGNHIYAKAYVRGCIYGSVLGVSSYILIKNSGKILNCIKTKISKKVESK